jgi:hypothetical protein
MPTNNMKRLSRGSLTTSETTLYTTPSGGQAVVTNIVLTNTTSSAITATIKLGTHEVLNASSVAANGVLAFDLRQTLESAEAISGFASAVGLKAHISGVEVTA